MAAEQQKERALQESQRRWEKDYGLRERGVEVQEGALAARTTAASEKRFNEAVEAFVPMAAEVAAAWETNPEGAREKLDSLVSQAIGIYGPEMGPQVAERVIQTAMGLGTTSVGGVGEQPGTTYYGSATERGYRPGGQPPLDFPMDESPMRHVRRVMAGGLGPDLFSSATSPQGMTTLAGQTQAIPLAARVMSYLYGG
jgi:hypothetical protein